MACEVNMLLFVLLSLQFSNLSYADEVVSGGVGDNPPVAVPTDGNLGAKQFECKLNGGSITFLFKAGTGFTIERSAPDTSSPEIEKRLAGLPEALRSKMRQGMAGMNKPQPAFDKCSQMKECKFGRPGDQLIVNCSNGNGSDQRKLEFKLLSSGTYQVNCSSAEVGDFKESIGTVKEEKISSATYQDVIPLNACRPPPLQ